MLLVFLVLNVDIPVMKMGDEGKQKHAGPEVLVEVTYSCMTDKAEVFGTKC